MIIDLQVETWIDRRLLNLSSPKLRKTFPTWLNDFPYGCYSRWIPFTSCPLSFFVFIDQKRNLIFIKPAIGSRLRQSPAFTQRRNWVVECCNIRRLWRTETTILRNFIDTALITSDCSIDQIRLRYRINVVSRQYMFFASIEWSIPFDTVRFVAPEQCETWIWISQWLCIYRLIFICRWRWWIIAWAVVVDFLAWFSISSFIYKILLMKQIVSQKISYLPFTDDSCFHVRFSCCASESIIKYGWWFKEDLTVDILIRLPSPIPNARQALIMISPLSLLLELAFVRS